MVAFSKFNLTVQQFLRKQHNCNGDIFQLVLIVAAGTPVAADDQYADVSADEVANGNGYTTGGNSITSVESNAAGTSTVRSSAAVPIWTASGAGFTFRYPVLFNTTAAGDELLGFWDYGSSLTLSGVNGDTFAALGLDTSIFTLV